MINSKPGYAAFDISYNGFMTLTMLLDEAAGGDINWGGARRWEVLYVDCVIPSFTL